MRPPLHPHDIRKLALIQLGGIGDLILYSPVIAELRTWLPDTHITLIMETRSSSIRDLLPPVDAIIELDVQDKSRPALFQELSGLLRRKLFDAVLSTGSSPFIPLMLFLSQVRQRVGYQTGTSSRWLLTQEAPLLKQAYASEMYFEVATTFLKRLYGKSYSPKTQARPILLPPHPSDQYWVKELMGQLYNNNGLVFSVSQPRVVIHPGSSQVARQKGIDKSWSASRWASLIRLLSNQGIGVLLAGGPDDAETIEGIMQTLPQALPHFANIFGQTKNIGQLYALIAACDALVCVDSSPLHLGVALQKPTVAMFGPTDPNKLLPQRTPQEKALYHAVTRDQLACRPCLWDVRQKNCDSAVCLNVEVEAMASELSQVLKTHFQPITTV